MKNQASTTYTFTHRLKGETRLELFENYYLRIKEKKLRREREFKLELAILNPKPLQVKNRAIHWLAAAFLSGLSAIYFLYQLVSAANYDNVWLILGVIFAAILLSAVFAVLFVYRKEQKWVLETRAAHYPLVEIPYRNQDKVAAKQFVQTLLSGIATNIAKKGYNDEVLFAGEMRMLRRLAKNHVLSIDAYDRAKKHMLEKSGNMGMAS